MSAVLKFALPAYVERQIPKIGNFKFTFFIVWIPDSFYHGPALFQQKIMVKAELKRILALSWRWDVPGFVGMCCSLTFDADCVEQIQQSLFICLQCGNSLWRTNWSSILAVHFSDLHLAICSGQFHLNHPQLVSFLFEQLTEPQLNATSSTQGGSTVHFWLSPTLELASCSTHMPLDFGGGFGLGVAL